MERDFEVYEGGLNKAKPNTAGFKDTAKRLRKGESLAHRTSLDWRLDRTNVCKRNQVVKTIAIEDLLDIVSKSRTASYMLNNDKMKNVEILYDEQVMPSQLYITPKQVVVALNPNRPKGELINTFTKELRHAWQYNNGTLVNPMGFEPDEAILINRVQYADSLVNSIKIAWELNLIGESEAWDYMGVSNLSGIVRTFEATARKDFRTLNNGEASRKVFDEFFGKNNSKTTDKKLIHQMLLDDKGYMKVTNKKSSVNIEFFSKMGEMPFSSNYLFVTGKPSPKDSSYYKVEDRSNANFLWFVKFECQYKEKEILMVKEVVKESAKIVYFNNYRNKAKSAFSSFSAA